MDAFILLFFGGLAIGAVVLWIGRRSTSRTEDDVTDHLPPKRINERDPYEHIEPLHDFRWETTPPIKQRPFRPKFHLTMGTENMLISELIAMDDTYLSRIQLRRSLIQTHPSSIIQCNPPAIPAVHELYTWLFTTYLPQRFPRTYRLSSPSSPFPHLLNLATNTPVPLSPPPSPTEALRIMGENIDTDFLFLLPSPSPSPPKEKDQPAHTYRLQAFVTCFPSGFSTQSKLGLPLAAIHAPVPGYAAKLAKSMDRFFARMPAGKAVRRANWTITTNGDRLFCEAGNHLHGAREEEGEGEGEEEEIRRQRDAVRIEDCRLRSERQTLHRLPRTGALVFAFKTYTYGLREVREEGDGEALAEAIEGLRKGSVPEFEYYKRGVVWGEKVVGYLRG